VGPIHPGESRLTDDPREATGEQTNEPLAAGVGVGQAGEVTGRVLNICPCLGAGVVLALDDGAALSGLRGRGAGDGGGRGAGHHPGRPGKELASRRGRAVGRRLAVGVGRVKRSGHFGASVSIQAMDRQRPAARLVPRCSSAGEPISVPGSRRAAPGSSLRSRPPRRSGRAARIAAPGDSRTGQSTRDDPSDVPRRPTRPTFRNQLAVAPCSVRWWRRVFQGGCPPARSALSVVSEPRLRSRSVCAPEHGMPRQPGAPYELTDRTPRGRQGGCLGDRDRQAGHSTSVRSNPGEPPGGSSRKGHDHDSRRLYEDSADRRLNLRPDDPRRRRRYPRLARHRRRSLLPGHSGTNHGRT
jgi:hypothetical protein